MITVIGAGMAGLLAANMLRHRDPLVYEIQKELPNNHSAVLRFRSPIVGDTLNIPFTKVTMIKAHVPWRNPIADALAYSYKCTGKYRSDRSIVQGTTVAERWIAPRDLIARMASRVDIKFNSPFTAESHLDYKDNSINQIISTLPMPFLMDFLKYPKRDQFKWDHVPGFNIRVEVPNCAAYISLLVPDPTFPFSRISLTGNELIVECPDSVMTNDDIGIVLGAATHLLGLPAEFKNISLYSQHYAKITPIDDDMRKDFMFWATDNFNIFSLGRYATWRPGLLLDDLVNDVRLIDRWISSGRYSIARHR